MSSKPQRLVILGSYLFAEEVSDVVEDIGKYDIVAFVENWNKERCSQQLFNRPIVWIDELQSYVEECLAICSIGSTQRVGFIEQITAVGMRFATIQHPSAQLSTKSTVGEGTFLNRGVIVAAYTTIGQHVIVNRGALIGHHTTVESYATISPGVNIGGAVTISERAYIGMGSTVLERLTVGRGAVVAAGAVVTKDVPDHTLVMGIPAKIVKEGIESR